MKMAKHIAAYTATGTKVINRVEKEEELEPVPAFSAEVEVELSREDPTLGSVARAFYSTPRVSRRQSRFSNRCLVEGLIRTRSLASREARLRLLGIEDPILRRRGWGCQHLPGESRGVEELKIWGCGRRREEPKANSCGPGIGGRETVLSTAYSGPSCGLVANRKKKKPQQAYDAV